eukprot:12417680-Ditylum_brightwellii.AAC.1
MEKDPCFVLVRQLHSTLLVWCKGQADCCACYTEWFYNCNPKPTGSHVLLHILQPRDLLIIEPLVEDKAVCM